MKQRRLTIHRRGAAVILVLMAVLGAAAGVASELIRGPEWTARTTVLVQFTPSAIVPLILNGSISPIDSSDLVDTAGTVTSSLVLRTVARELGDDTTITELKRSISAVPVTASHLVNITATAPTRARSERLADLAAQSLSDQQRQEVTTATANLPAGTGSSTDLQTRASLVAARVDPIRIMGAASATQTSPSRTLPVVLGVVGLAAGALIIIGLTWGRRERSPWSRPT